MYRNILCHPLISYLLSNVDSNIFNGEKGYCYIEMCVLQYTGNRCQRGKFPRGLHAGSSKLDLDHERSPSYRGQGKPCLQYVTSYG